MHWMAVRTVWIFTVRLWQRQSMAEGGGWLFFEIGYDQGEALRTLLADFGYTEIGIRQDLAGLDRVAFGRYTGKKEGA